MRKMESRPRLEVIHGRAAIRGAFGPRGAIPAPMGAAQLDKFWKADFDYWRPVVQSVKLD